MRQAAETRNIAAAVSLHAHCYIYRRCASCCFYVSLALVFRGTAITCQPRANVIRPRAHTPLPKRVSTFRKYQHRALGSFCVYLNGPSEWSSHHTAIELYSLVGITVNGNCRSEGERERKKGRASMSRAMNSDFPRCRGRGR